MNILVTGASGFIGLHLCDKILKNTNYKAFGVDNLDPYYSTKLKKKIINRLKKNKKFTNIFSSIDETIEWHKKVNY